MPFSVPKPSNLGLSREACIAVSIGGFIMALSALILGVLFLGVTQANAPIIILVISLMGTSLGGLIGNLKATEAADTAAKTQQVAELTASQAATFQQMLMVHCSHLCPLGDMCGLRSTKEWPA